MSNKYSLIGVDGNAFSVIGYVSNSMKSEGKSEEEIKAYRDLATSSDYNNLLACSVSMIERLNNGK